MKNGTSKVFEDRPAYADFDSAAKFNAIQSIVAQRLTEHPNAICSYSGGSDSDILIDIIERTRKAFDLPPVNYVFFNTGLERLSKTSKKLNRMSRLWSRQHGRSLATAIAIVKHITNISERGWRQKKGKSIDDRARFNDTRPAEREYAATAQA